MEEGMDVNEVIREMEGALNRNYDALGKELARIRTGRASIAILDSVRVDYYGTKTPLNQCASLSTPEPRLIVVRPWDKNVAAEIEKAILAANLGLTPSSDGEIIRIPVPPLTEERRKELVKMIKRYGEDHKVSIRNARRDSNEMLKEMEKEGEISEDENKKAAKKIQDLTDQASKKIDEMIAQKEKEIMEI
jgi:ribosome recycling factor